MLFKFDENLPVKAADLFRDEGHDAATVLEQGMKGHDDESLADVRREESRTLVTLDVDFADITAYPTNYLIGPDGRILIGVGQEMRLRGERLLETLTRIVYDVDN